MTQLQPTALNKPSRPLSMEHLLMLFAQSSLPNTPTCSQELGFSAHQWHPQATNLSKANLTS